MVTNYYCNHDYEAIALWSVTTTMRPVVGHDHDPDLVSWSVTTTRQSSRPTIASEGGPRPQDSWSDGHGHDHDPTTTIVPWSVTTTRQSSRGGHDHETIVSPYYCIGGREGGRK